MVNIHNLIAAISPEVYCDPDKIDKETSRPLKEAVKKIVKEKGYLEAAKIAEPFKSGVMFNYDEAKKDPMSSWGLKSPNEQHELKYDSATENLEPIYFWILDFLEGPYKETEKIIDNFASSPGSGHFSEIQTRVMQMQQEVSRTMGNINTVIKSILNLLYDLKDFKLRLEPYEKYKKSQEAKERYGSLLSLKQIWLDNVDIKKGRGSINALSSGELDFVTLRDAFMALQSRKHAGELDLNERVKRIIIQRAEEFFKWIDESEHSLTQRFEIEKNYLKSQVNMLKLYTRWVKPYLNAAQKLEQKYSSMQSALVSTFNTKIMELVLLAKSPYDPKDDVSAGLLPEVFTKVKARKYSSILIVEFKFRSIPQKISQRGDWAFGGRTDIKFTSYSLNDQELSVLKQELEKDDMGEALKLIEGATADSLQAIEKDLNEFLEDKNKKEEKKQSSDSDTNPFTALFSGLRDFFKSKKKEEKEDLSKGIKPDNDYEKIIRSQSIISAREKCFTVFDVYKKAHGMASHVDTFQPL